MNGAPAGLRKRSASGCRTLGRERSFLEDLFGNIGQVGAPGMGGGAGGPGPQ